MFLRYILHRIASLALKNKVRLPPRSPVGNEKRRRCVGAFLAARSRTIASGPAECTYGIKVPFHAGTRRLSLGTRCIPSQAIYDPGFASGSMGVYP